MGGGQAPHNYDSKKADSAPPTCAPYGKYQNLMRRLRNVETYTSSWLLRCNVQCLVDSYLVHDLLYLAPYMECCIGVALSPCCTCNHNWLNCCILGECNLIGLHKVVRYALRANALAP